MDTARPNHVGDPELPYVRQWQMMGLALRTWNMKLPDTYLVIDIETDGLSPAKNNILQVGFVQVINGEVKNANGVFIETPEDDLVSYENGDYVRRKLAEGNEGFIKASDVRAHGVPRALVFQTLKQLIDATMALPGALIVGHNLVGFDLAFIETFSRRCAGVEIVFDRNRVFDTSAMFKANKLGMLPADGEPLYDFFCKVHGTIARGVYWRLEVACKELGLAERHQLDLEKAHDAAADTMFTHYVYMALRERMAA